MFVSAKDLEAFTGLQRPVAQARFLGSLGMKFVRRTDGSIALRQVELDARTLSDPWSEQVPKVKQQRMAKTREFQQVDGPQLQP